MTETSTGPAETIFDLTTAYFVSRALHVVADLGVADALGDEPMAANALAAKVGAHPQALFRVMRALASHGVFVETDGKFAHSAASRLLRSDHPRSLRPWVRMIGLPLNWNAYADFAYSVRTGKSARDTLIEGDFFADYLPKHPELGALFNQSMTSKAHRQVAAIVEAYDFSKFKIIADIGGGRGHLIQGVLAATPSAKGVLFDLKHVARPVLDQASDRLAIWGGDFFKDDLPVCDAYLLMNVIHDWSDEASIAILKSVRRVAPEGAKLLVVERIIPEGGEPDPSKRMDLHMLAVLSGRERTLKEFEALFVAAGFRLVHVTSTASDMFVIESAPLD